MPVFRQYAVHMGEMVLQAQDGQAGIQRIARGKVVGVQIADDCLGFDFQQSAEVCCHVLEELERLKVFQVAHMLAEESILAAREAERVLEFRACGQYAAARVAGEFQRPRHEPPCPSEEVERRGFPEEASRRRVPGSRFSAEVEGTPAGVPSGREGEQAEGMSFFCG